jgi:hypothetical protein
MHLINLSYLPPYLSVPTILYEKQPVDTFVFFPARPVQAPTTLTFQVNGFLLYSVRMLNFHVLYDHLVSKLNFSRR